MKLGPVTKLDKKTQQRQKKLKLTSCLQIVTSFSFLLFMANLEQSESQILDAWFCKTYIFIKLHMSVYLRTKFQVSSTILTSFRQRWGVHFPLPPQNKPLKRSPRSGLIKAKVKSGLLN